MQSPNVRRSRALFVLPVLISLIGCDDKADIGAECEPPGSTDVCVSGAVCTNDSGGQRCRAVCSDDKQCASTEACNGVSSTNIKSCQPKK